MAISRTPGNADSFPSGCLCILLVRPDRFWLYAKDGRDLLHPVLRDAFPLRNCGSTDAETVGYLLGGPPDLEEPVEAFVPFHGPCLTWVSSRCKPFAECR